MASTETLYGFRLFCRNQNACCLEFGAVSHGMFAVCSHELPCGACLIYTARRAPLIGPGTGAVLPERSSIEFLNIIPAELLDLK